VGWRNDLGGLVLKGRSIGLDRVASPGAGVPDLIVPVRIGPFKSFPSQLVYLLIWFQWVALFNPTLSEEFIKQDARYSPRTGPVIAVVEFDVATDPMP
jgi:hypothetical protein